MLRDRSWTLRHRIPSFFCRNARVAVPEPKSTKMKAAMKMQRLVMICAVMICALSGSVALVGCGQEKNTLIGAGDPEAAAAYDQLIAEQKMGAGGMAKVEKEMAKTEE